MTAAQHRLFFAALLAAGSALPAALRAQTVIDSLTTTTFTGSPSGPVTTDETNFTFTNSVTAVTSFTAGSTTYEVSGTADQVFIRRNAVNATQSSVWYASAGGGVYTAPHSEDYGQLLLGNNINRGSDNTFANGTGLPEGNIERLDFVYTSPLSANESMGFAVFERGAATVHDGFKIALITGWDGVNNVPTAYSELFFQAPNWTPAVNAGDDFSYTLFRYNANDNLSATTAATETGTQGIGGVVFTIDDFNVTPGTPLYGYSLFGYDVTDGGSPVNLIDYTNATFFPTTTDGATGGGGIDLAAVNGITFSAIPEPSTWALGGVTLAGLAIAARRRATAKAGVQTAS
jgi:hypothetical protein